MMHIDDKYNDGYGTYMDPEGCSWENAVDFIQGYILDFCCCGSPEQNLLYVYEVLKRIDTKENLLTTKEEFFAWYVFHKMGLTEHGGSVPGWLTEKGRELLEDLEELKEELEEEIK